LSIKKNLWDKLLHYLNKLSPNTRKQLISFSYLAKYYGQYNSIKQNLSIDSKNNPLPWLTYPSIEYLRNLDLTNETIFELGSGFSTLWFAKRSKKVFSVETDELWYNKIVGELSSFDNVEIDLVNENHGNEIFKGIEESDLIFIDGLDREDALDYIIENIDISKIKCIVVDNSEWESVFKKIQQFVEYSKWVDFEFVGFGPINRYVWSTHVLMNPENKIMRKNKSINPINDLH
tara:strand:- start:1969 stop:2667 length:699 start_codon:yes stop_codon:yes gene_type:complete